MRALHALDRFCARCEPCVRVVRAADETSKPAAADVHVPWVDMAVVRRAVDHLNAIAGKRSIPSPSAVAARSGTAHYTPFVSSWCVGAGEGESTMDVAGGGRSVENIHQFRRADSLLLSMFADGMMLKACTHPHPHPHPSLPLRPSLSRTLSHSHAHSRPSSSHRHSSRLLALCRMHRPIRTSAAASLSLPPTTAPSLALHGAACTTRQAGSRSR